MTKPIYVLNGPNLNRLGKREPEIYGTTTLAEVEAMCRQAAGGHPLEFRQSNAEHQIVDWIHEAIYHNSLVSRVATAVLAGLGPDGYPTAVAAMLRLLNASASKAGKT